MLYAIYSYNIVAMCGVYKWCSIVICGVPGILVLYAIAIEIYFKIIEYIESKYMPIENLCEQEYEVEESVYLDLN